MLLISICGNTGVGKSTLLHALEVELRRRQAKSVFTFDEAQFHHVYLDRMFAAPQFWAFTIQLNFIIQRSAALRWAAEKTISTITIMERSLEEDFLFFKYYCGLGCFSIEEQELYHSVHQQLSSGVSEPAIMLFLRGDPEQQIRRVEQDIACGRRVAEYRGDRLRNYVYDLHSIYDNWWSNGAKDSGKRTARLSVEPLSDSSAAVDLLIKAINL
jgi:deoxyadenosine/deoxycytidine kinase